MESKFLSNIELVKLLEKATTEERLAVSKVLDNDVKTPYSAKTLQEKISREGGHGVVNLLRGQGTGYLDILDDVAKALKISGLPDYAEEVQYYDEIFYLKDTYSSQNSKVKRLYSTTEAQKLGREYALTVEEKIIVELIKKSYEQMIEDEKRLKKKIASLDLEKKEISLKLEQLSDEKDIKIGPFFENGQWKHKTISALKKEAESSIEVKQARLEKINHKMHEANKSLKELQSKIDTFNSSINEVAAQFGSKNMALAGATGIMALANLGGFATYTFLTSMMSTISMGTLGFGAYTAATSFLSIVIGPVGWAGLGAFALFSLGKPKMSKLILIIATVGTIRQRLKYESNE